jgi:uncharacterized protein involved in response to NO
MAPIPRLQAYDGPALLSYGFRPFFLLGAFYAGAEILAWLPMFYGELSVATAFAPRDWHVHELLFGYVPAVVTGFLLTAIPNWTGRLPIQGTPLLLLVVVWMSGRIAVALSAHFGWVPTAVIDVAFLVLVASVTAREIIAGHNWRNLKLVGILSLLAAGNLAFHVEAHFRGNADYATRAGISVVLILIMVMGGRLIPSFTHSWLARKKPGRLPTPFGRFDLICMVFSAAGLALWLIDPFGTLTGVTLIACGILNLARLARWAGDRTVAERLVLVLHLGYAFVPIGFVLTGLAALGVLTTSAGVHAWTVGAIGTMTLAVMTRASLGHTGHELTASASVQFMYAAIIVAAVARVCASLHVEWNDALLHTAALAWAAAFIGFSVAFGPALFRPRKVAKGAPA